MDPARRELYVEGARDRRFLAWAFRDKMGSNALIREIGYVDIEGPREGGERARLLAFGRWLSNTQANIRCFADADMDRVLVRSIPSHVWLTDGRDLEGYVLNVPCLEKVLSVGIGADVPSARKLLRAVLTQGRKLGLLRVLSELDSLRLPFRNTRLSRYVDYSGGRLQVDLDAYLQTLLQNAQISLTRLPHIRIRLGALEVRFKDIPDFELIHGKDAFCLIEKALSHFKLGENELARLLWTSFECSHVANHPNLTAIASFLS